MVESRNIAVLLLLAAALAVACISSPLLAPGDGEIVLDANPLTIVLDQFADPPVTTGSAIVSAEIFNADGVPQPDVSVTFSTNGGELASAPAGEIPTQLKTDDNGFVSDTLSVQLGDPESISVTVRSGGLSGVIAVEKQEALPNRPPFAFIDIRPEGAAVEDEFVTFDGSLSEDPDGDTITCYRWEIRTDTDILIQGDPCENPSSRCEAYQGPGQTQVQRRYSVLVPRIDVSLFVTDDPAVDCLTNGTVVPEASFNGKTGASYSVVCDRTAPIADGGGNQTVRLGAPLQLVGAGSDPESDTLTYLWSCGNGTTSSESSIVCTYDSTGPFEATFRVTNECGLFTTDIIPVTVN